MASDAGPAVGLAEPGVDMDDAESDAGYTNTQGTTTATADAAGDEVDLDALFEEADRADGYNAGADDEDDGGPIESPPRVEEAVDVPIEMAPTAAVVDDFVAEPGVEPPATEHTAEADAERIDDAAEDADAPGDILIESGIFDPVPGEAGWGPGTPENAGAYEGVEVEADDEAVERVDSDADAPIDAAPDDAAAVGTGEVIDALRAQTDDVADAAEQAAEDAAVDGESVGQAAATEDGIETTGEADASAVTADEEPPAGDLSDQVLIDDELPDEGKMPGTTHVLPSETLAAAAGDDRSAALANQSDAYEFEEDDSIGLADDEPKPSVFDRATEEPAADAPTAADEAIDTQEDLIRIGDDTPIVREPAPEEPTDAKAKTDQPLPEDSSQAEPDALPMPTLEAAPDELAVADEAEAEQDDTRDDHEYVVQDVDAEDDLATEDAADALSTGTVDEPEAVDEERSVPDDEQAKTEAKTAEPDAIDNVDAETDLEITTPAAVSDTADPEAQDVGDSEDVDALRAALAQLVDEDGPACDTESTPRDTDVEESVIVDEAEVIDEADAGVDTPDDAVGRAIDFATRDTEDAARGDDDDAFDQADDAADAEIAAALADDIEPGTDEGSSHSPQTTDNTPVNEASPELPVSEDDADLERIDDIDTAAQAELDPSETDYDAPLPASFGPNAGSASAVGRELDADANEEHAALIDETALPLDAFGTIIEKVEDDTDGQADAPLTAQPPHGQNPTTTLAPVEPKSSYRSMGPPSSQGQTRKRLGFAAAILFVLGLGAALYFGVINPGIITGKTNRPTDPQPVAPGNNTPDRTNPDAQTNRNIPGVPDTPGNIEPADPLPNLPDGPTAPIESPGHVAGIARTPNPFDNTPRVIGGDALAGRTTDDPTVTRPGTPPPDENLLSPGPRPIPPLIIPLPGGNTNPPNPIDPGNTNPNPDLAGGNDTPPNETTDTNIDPTAPIDGDRLVFLVDCSGSLVDSLPQMLLWLHDAIATLQPGETFTIIFFKKDEAFEPTPPGLKPLTRAYLADLDREWLNPNASPILPAGRSDPAAAFELALTYDPSDIYLLSDESFAQRAGDTTPEEAATFVTETLGDADVRLHGVQFFYDSGDSTLQALAEQFDGSYEFVAETRHPDRDPIDLLEELENRNP
ncbi:hypothetical protein OT109_13560 [Phycisphaeraceae bacterium D3-23]